LLIPERARSSLSVMPVSERFNSCRLVSANITQRERERENELKRLTTQAALHNAAAAQQVARSTGKAVHNEGMREFGFMKRERA
jgi:hypothetical protein